VLPMSWYVTMVLVIVLMLICHDVLAATYRTVQVVKTVVRRRSILLHGQGRLAMLERQRMRYWNVSSARLLVLGQKSSRDFGVYAWAFGVHRFRLSVPETGVLFLSDDQTQRPAAPDVGALLCHSLFLSNCVRPRERRISREGAVFNRVEGMKINRIAGVRQVLSTKDGLCRTLQVSGLSAAAIWNFSFPCWTLPQDGALLARQLDRERSHAIGGRGSTTSDGAASGVAPVWRSGWIVKPAHGSHGMGIRVVNSTADLFTGVLAPSSLRAMRSPLVIQPYLRSPLLHHGRKWDVRTYVLATSVLRRLELLAERHRRGHGAHQHLGGSASAAARREFHYEFARRPVHAAPLGRWWCGRRQQHRFRC
jgi:hypothetical protein